MDAKAGARERLDSARAALVALSRRIHAAPELAFEEERAAAWIADWLADAGFRVRRAVCGLPTAFIATCGTGPLHVAFLAEYDALPAIGHACGHNVIAALAAGAGAAAAHVADDVGLTVSVIGTPAEETGGGKTHLLAGGAFEGVHAAMMAHPAPVDIVVQPFAALWEFDVHYHGKAAHASAFPELGINAADAITVAQTAIGLLRQHIGPTDRVHGIVTHGGDAPNVVPAHTTARYDVRGRSLADVEVLRARVLRCLEAGALATGARMDVRETGAAYAEMRHDAVLGELYRANAESLGRRFPDLGGANRAIGSTDMGNVSQVLPAIHPMIGLDSWPAVNHQPEFAAHCIGPAAEQALADGALALAWTAIDAARDVRLRQQLRSDFRRT
jgi:amidohydrolase